MNIYQRDTHIQPDVFKVNCGSRRVLDLLADTWSILVLYALEPSPMRYGELERKIEGISQKMLTQTLKKLQQDGLIERVIHEEVSSRPVYQLSRLGHTLLYPLGALCAWAQDNMGDVDAARLRYRGEQES